MKDQEQRNAITEQRQQQADGTEQKNKTAQNRVRETEKQMSSYDGGQASGAGAFYL